MKFDLKHNEYRFRVRKKKDSSEKISKIFAKSYEAAYKQALERFKEDEWIYISCLKPDGVVIDLEK